MNKYSEIVRNEMEELGSLFVKTTEMKMKNIFNNLLEEIPERINQESKEGQVKLKAQTEILLELKQRLFD